MTFTPEQRERVLTETYRRIAEPQYVGTPRKWGSLAADICCERDQARRERDLAREAMGFLIAYAKPYMQDANERAALKRAQDALEAK